MTDSYLMDAECIHGEIWYECETCERIDREALMTDCRCAVVRVGGKPTGSLNWNPDCPVHPWTEEMRAQSDRAVEWQRRAREARSRR